MSLPPTPSQTIGPFFHRALLREEMNDLTAAGAAGVRITIEGRVLDGDNAPVSDALIEIWQANTAGRYDHPEDRQEKKLDPNFHGYGRIGTDEHGRFRFRTIKPGPVPGNGNARQAPHINVSIFTRGLLKRLVTRIYFPDEPLSANDPVLSAIRDTSRRATLVAHKMAAAPEPLFRFDIVLQGANETVFFDV
ncbi:MAG: protocatechuate 3,4-dioxygenase subunit alpha [Candidatus Binataceae bacterium]